MEDQMDLRQVDTLMRAEWSQYSGLCHAVRAMLCVDCLTREDGFRGWANDIGQADGVIIRYAQSLIAVFSTWGVEA